MAIVGRIAHFSQAFAAGLALCWGGSSGARADSPDGPQTGASAVPSSSDAQPSLPQQSLFSSLKQAFNKDFDHEVVRGHFDLGTAPNVRRYYCLVDAKTGKKEPNGVLGQPVTMAGGMTGIQDGSVSLYSCRDAEKQGMLITAGYVPNTGTAGVTAPALPAQKQVVALPVASPDRVDVAGVKLGMSPEEVRRVLQSKKLSDYFESTDTLAHLDSAKGARPIANGRFVNVIATWVVREEEGESYEVMFTPVPDKERAMAIVHSVGYSRANAVRETALDKGLVKKYGGFAAPDDVPGSPTWRFQSVGNVQVGDPCSRRGIFGGLRALNMGNAVRQNLALKTTLDEFRFQIDHCGLAIVTADHSTANGGAPREDRIVTRFTVTAYSPSIGLEGATAAQLIQTATEAEDKTSAARVKDQGAPDL